MKKTSSRRGSRTAAHIELGELPPGWMVKRAGRLAILQEDSLNRLSWLVHGFSTRPGGVSHLGGSRKSNRAPVLNLGCTDWDTRANIEKNRGLFTTALGVAKMPLVSLRQCHTDILHVVSEPPAGALRGDALLTQAPGLLLAVQTADCVPILLADTRRRAIAAVHAGWRGTLARITEKTVGRMCMEFGTRAEDLVAVLGPSISGSCYEVGPEVVTAFAGQFPAAREWFDGAFDLLATGEQPNPLPWLSMTPPGHDPPAPRAYLDLRAALRWQLLEAGVSPENIVSSDLCTACRTDLLFSHRREQGRTGRLIGVIGILG